MKKKKEMLCMPIPVRVSSYEGSTKGSEPNPTAMVAKVPKNATLVVESKSCLFTSLALHPQEGGEGGLCLYPP